MIKNYLLSLAFALSLAGGVSAAQAQTTPNSTITSGTQSTAQQQSTIANSVNLGGGGPSDVTYHGGYSVKSAPTVYAPALTASITETCWGSVSGGVSVMGVGVTGAATIKDYDCNRRLNAAVAGRMGRMDIAFNLMCQDDSFREAAAGTDKPCPSTTVQAKQGTEIVPVPKDSADALKTSDLPKNVKTYATADTSSTPSK